ncbi:MFS transporter [Sphingosinithalassobacter portus]|uniref:MFS transporter n=1 Tax=Stakelama portus TaxID=2676234 RepID=UPI000D6E6F16|nr:MFS transporter [Sphingosinithalassobacter portus]
MATDYSKLSPAYRGYALGLMTVMFTLANIDRSILSILIEPIRIEYGLSDTQVGMLTGLAFAVPYAIFVIPLGAMADRANRVRLIVLLMLGWSTLTAATGLAQSFLILVLARMALGAAESGCAPTLTSLTSDIFPAKRRGSAMSWLYFSSPLGVTLGLAIGGLVAAHFSWRTAFFVVGLPGLALALLAAFTLREPVRETTDGPNEGTKEPSSIAKALGVVMRDRRLLFLMLGGAFCIGGQAATSIFMGPFLIRLHNMDVGQAGTLLALTYGIGGMIGMPLGGYITDYITSRFPGRELTFFGFVNIVVFVIAAAAFLVPSWPVAIALLAIYSAGCVLYYGVTFASFAQWSPPHLRAGASAVLLLAMNLFGYGVAPQFAGVMSDVAGAMGVAQPLRIAMVGSSTLFAIGGIFLLFAGRAAMRRGTD